MLSSNPRSTASVRGHPLHAMLVPIPIVCFVGTLVTDIVYWQTAAMLWADMSAWLLAVGLIVSVLAAAAGLIDFCSERRIRELRPAGIQTNLPVRYRGGAFVGEHGSLDRTVLNGYKIVFVSFENGRPSGQVEDVVTGFLVDGDKARGRPVGLAVDSQGGLLIADDTGNSVWRVTAAAPLAMSRR